MTFRTVISLANKVLPVRVLRRNFGKACVYSIPQPAELSDQFDVVNKKSFVDQIGGSKTEVKMVLKLYKMDFSPPVRAVFMVIEALEIPDVEMIDINLFQAEHYKEEYIKINPQHTIPVLIDDDVVICESHAISTYLVDKYGKDDSLYPKDLKKRAMVDQRLFFDSGILFPCARGAGEPLIFRGAKGFSPEIISKITAGYVFAERFLSRSPWLAGDQLTLADICCVSTISSMDIVVPIEEATYPNLYKWFKRCSEFDFYKKKNVPGLEIMRGYVKAKLADGAKEQ
ncbi:unnamed protein product [Chrysodeixis includens]|uniref:Uncharacterized protein n=1 Tax=Chrysodeixis includens TaxID=689277 RepID=A0A9P0BP27_CHRIL|nr:unnamed protein product [Chrysodeixis includens]